MAVDSRAVDSRFDPNYNPASAEAITDYNAVITVVSCTPGLGIYMFFANWLNDDFHSKARDGTIPPEGRSYLIYKRWRDLTVSLGLTAAILFIIAIAAKDIGVGPRTDLAIAGGAITAATIGSGRVAYAYRKKWKNPPEPKGNICQDYE